MSSPHAVLELVWAWAIPSLHAVLELACYHYMQFLSLWHICHALITCSSGACVADVMSPLHTLLEYILGIWYAIIKCNFGACDTYVMTPIIALYCFALLCITSYYVVLLCWSLGGVSSLEPPPKWEMLCKMCAYEWEYVSYVGAFGQKLFLFCCLFVCFFLFVCLFCLGVVICVWATWGRHKGDIRAM